MKRNEFVKNLGFGIGFAALTSCKSEFSDFTEYNTIALDNISNDESKGKLIELVNNFNFESQKFSSDRYVNSIFYKKNLIEASKKLMPDNKNLLIDYFDKKDIFSLNEKVFTTKNYSNKQLDLLKNNFDKEIDNDQKRHLNEFSKNVLKRLKENIKSKEDIKKEKIKELINSSFEGLKSNIRNSQFKNINSKNALESIVTINETFPNYYSDLYSGIINNSFDNYRLEKQVNSTLGNLSWWSDFWNTFVDVIQVVVYVSVIVSVATASFFLLGGATLFIAIGAGMILGGAVFVGSIAGLIISYIINEP